MRLHKIHTVRELTDADLQLVAMADQLEADGQHLDLVETIRIEVDRGHVTTADLLRLRRLVRRRDAGHADPAFERWAVGMLRGRFSEPASWW